MFGNEGAAGLGFQWSMYRLLDAMDESKQATREMALSSRLSDLVHDYNDLLAHTQAVERDLQQRTNQLASAQGEMALGRQQHAATRDELARTTTEVKELRATILGDSYGL